MEITLDAPITMDSRLFEAALTENVRNLHLLLAENPLTLQTVDLASAGNPLHVTSAYGHIDFVKEIIRLKPDFSEDLNQDGFSPLHMASANGHIEIVRELIKLDPKICHLQGSENRTPLHFAAVKGRVHVLSELMSACPECAEDVTIQGETALHFVGHGANDSGGLDVNAINQSGLTALDVLVTFPSEAGDREIEEILRSSGALRKKDITISSNLCPELNNETSVNRSATAAQTHIRRSNDLVEYFKFKKGRDSPGETRSALLVVAALVATATFQFAVNPPGGLWQDNNTSKAYKAGESILGSVDKVGYAIFMFFNTMGFKLSIHMISILTTNFPLQFELQSCFLAVYFTYDTVAINLAPDGIRLFVILTVSIMPALSWGAYLVRKHRKRLTKQTLDP